MTQPELIHADWSLFRADGNWYPIGHGIEIMAYLYMEAGTFYIRAADTVKPLPRGSGQGPDLALTPLVEHEPGGYQQADP